MIGRSRIAKRVNPIYLCWYIIFICSCSWLRYLDFETRVYHFFLSWIVVFSFLFILNENLNLIASHIWKTWHWKLTAAINSSRRQLFFLFLPSVLTFLIIIYFTLLISACCWLIWEHHSKIMILKRPPLIRLLMSVALAAATHRVV